VSGVWVAVGIYAVFAIVGTIIACRSARAAKLSDDNEVKGENNK
jgi:hypothetical protein